VGNALLFFLLKALLNSQLLGLNLLVSAFVLKQQKLAIVEKTSHRRQTSTIGYPTRLALVGLAGTLMVTEPVLALPQGGQVLEGKAKIQQVNPDQLNINQQSDRAVINWQGFSVGEQQQVNFQQPSTTSATLNRVTGKERSSIAGRVTANGQVMFVNPNGIVFGPSAQIDVAGLTATTLDIRNQDFMNGRYSFQAVRGKPGATVENFGQVTVKEGGFAALVAPGVSNSGVINARLGKVVLASGTQATLDFSGDGLVSLAVDPTLAQQVQGADGKPLSSLVNQSGKINADGGVVTLSARTGGAVVDSAINMSGVIQARSVSNQRGKIVLSGENQGKVTVTGTLDTSGKAGQSGGNISAFSDGAIDTSKGSLNTGSDTGYGGDIYFSANGNITTGNLNAAGAVGNGSIDLYSNTGNIDTTAGTLSGGSVTLNTDKDIQTGNINSRSNADDEGNIALFSNDGAIDTTKGSLNSSSDTGYGGAISLAANGNITTGNINSTGAVSNGGTILYSKAGSINTTAGTLNVGAVTL
jgi:filamentous hemagglutinin family protein